MTAGLLAPVASAGATEPGSAVSGALLSTLPADGPTALLLAMGICILAGLGRLCWPKPAPVRVRTNRRIGR